MYAVAVVIVVVDKNRDSILYEDLGWGSRSLHVADHYYIAELTVGLGMRQGCGTAAMVRSAVGLIMTDFMNAVRGAEVVITNDCALSCTCSFRCL